MKITYVDNHRQQLNCMTIASIIAGSAALTSAIIGGVTARKNRKSQEKENEIIRKREDTAIQRATNDMRMAGLNPAVGTTPSAPTTETTAPVTDMSGVSDALTNGGNNVANAIANERNVAENQAQAMNSQADSFVTNMGNQAFEQWQNAENRARDYSQQMVTHITSLSGHSRNVAYTLQQSAQDVTTHLRTHTYTEQQKQDIMSQVNKVLGFNSGTTETGTLNKEHGLHLDGRVGNHKDGSTSPQKATNGTGNPIVNPNGTPATYTPKPATTKGGKAGTLSKVAEMLGFSIDGGYKDMTTESSANTKNSGTTATSGETTGDTFEHLSGTSFTNQEVQQITNAIALEAQMSHFENESETVVGPDASSFARMYSMYCSALYDSDCGKALTYHFREYGDYAKQAYIDFVKQFRRGFVRRTYKKSSYGKIYYAPYADVKDLTKDF